MFASAKRIDSQLSSAVGQMSPKCSPTSNLYNDGSLAFPEYSCAGTACSRAPNSALIGTPSGTNLFNG